MCQPFHHSISIVFLFLLFLFPGPAIPANGLLVRGRVVDSGSGDPLPNANVVVEKTGQGTSTDEEGFFEIRLPVGEHRMAVSFIGFESVEQSIVAPAGAESLYVDIRLSPASVPLPAITVVADSTRTNSTQYLLPSRQIRNMAGPLPDPLLTLQTLPGVSALNDQSSLFNVRGRNFDENLIYINGFEVYSPQLVRNSVSENPSLVNPSLLQSINFRTGAFPVSYGDKLSSVLDVSYGAHSLNGPRLAAEVSSTGVNGLVARNLGSAASMQIAGRLVDYSYLLNAREAKGRYSPSYLDLQTTAYFQPSERLRVSFLGIVAASNFRAGRLVDSTNVNLRIRTNVDFDGEEEYNHDTGLAGISFDYALRPAISTRIAVSYFSQREEENTDRMVQVDRYEFGELVSSMLSSEEAHTYYHGKFLTSDFSVRWLLSPHVVVDAGLHLKSFTIADSISLMGTLSQMPGEERMAPDFVILRTPGERRGSLFGRFVQTNIVLNDRTHLQVGLRWTTASFNDEQLWLPRAQLLFKYSERHEFILAGGRYAQPPVYKEFLFRDQHMSGLRAPKGTKFTLGYHRLINGSMSLKAEAFYTKYTDLISYDLEDVRIRYSGLNDASGAAYGVDLFVFGSFLPTTDNWISYSYLVATEDFKDDGEGGLPSPTDRRHQVTMYSEDTMEGWEWSKLFARVVFGTGYPFTYRQWVWDEGAGRYRLELGRRNLGRLPFYYRIDIGFTQTLKLGQWGTITLREEVLNLFDRKNVLGLYRGQSAVKHYLSGRIFNFGLRAEF
jgi:hypothetical protein